MAGERHGTDPRIDELFFRANQAMQAGLMAEAVPLQREALELARQEHRDLVGGTRSAERLGGLLYGLGSSLVAIGRPAEAVELLTECEQVYQQVPGTEARVADVYARRSQALAAQGFGVSAVLEADEAAHRYVRLDAGRPDSPLGLDLARVLALTADVLRRYADPDLAAVAADWAIRAYLSRVDQINAGPDAGVHAGYLVVAAGIAAEVHGAHGRTATALEADGIAVATARSRRRPVELAAALTRLGAHLGSAGRAAEAEQALGEALALDPATVDATATRLRAAPPVTFAAALDRAAADGEVAAGVRGLLVDPMDGGSPPFPTARCQGDPRLAAILGLQLGRYALRLLPPAPAEGRRLALEAHYLLAIASRDGELSMRYAFGGIGAEWARLLLATARSHRAAGEHEMARDLARWLAGVAVRLRLQIPGDPLLAECDAVIREIGLPD